MPKPLPQNHRPCIVVLACLLTLAARHCRGAQTEINRRYTETSLGPFPPEVRESAVLSPDGRHLAYVDSSDGPGVVLDGKPQPVYDRVTGASVQPDGAQLAYAAQRGGRWCIVAGGGVAWLRAGRLRPSSSPDGFGWPTSPCSTSASRGGGGRPAGPATWFPPG